MDAIKLIIGLGNPGSEYARTRHNAGFWFMDTLAEKAGVVWGAEKKLFAETAKIQLAGQSMHLLKPSTFMNHSGRALVAALQYWKIQPEQCLIAHDELDLEPGVARLKFDGGHGGQNGLRDSIAQLGHGRFHRLRLGIGHPGHKDKVTPWVLGRPGLDDGIAMQRAIEAAQAVLPLLVEGRFNDAMKQLHTPAPK
jgi:peptidyl-tRNA hydrolase, PTH1 family